MLQHLTIRQFALIDHYDIDFGKGLTVLTGETGAGKSILIDALSLALGGRAEAKSIREGATQAEVIAAFDISALPHVQAWLEERALYSEELCLLRRLVQPEGKSRAFINGTPVTVAELNALGSLLVDLHGQHEHHFLLKREHQLKLLDTFGQHQPLLEKLSHLVSSWQQLQKEKERYAALQGNASQAEFLIFQLEELNALALQAGEVATLEADFKRLSQSETVMQRCQIALQLLEEDDFNVTRLLSQLKQQLIPTAALSESLANALKNIEQAEVSVQEAQGDLQHYLTHFDASPERLKEISDRLDAIHRLARKHRVKPDELVSLVEIWSMQLQECEKSQEKLEALSVEQEKIEKQYEIVAKELSKSREKIAQKLGRLVSEKLHELAMPSAVFSVQFSPQAGLHRLGQERAEFFVQMNPGSSAQPLAKVASGGELSRVSLAIQVILASGSVMPTLIFDEVDVGIGGMTATTVGKALKALSQHVQVLCVTHLPQVAAFGSQHYRIEKQVVKKQTRTLLTVLLGDGREEEIARMLGGESITPQSLAHAKELLTQAS